MRSPKSLPAKSGTTRYAAKKDTTRLAAIVSDSALKNAPVTPVRNASGAKMMMVEVDDPISGRENSAVASLILSTAVPPAPRRRRMMCSISTMESSMMRPTAAAMPPSVMMLKLMLRVNSTSTVTASTAGTMIAAIIVVLKFCRKISRISTAKITPITTAFRTDLAELTMSRLWSYQLATFTSFGRRAESSASRDLMSAAICTVLPPGCWKICSSTASWPSAVTRDQAGWASL